MKNRIMMILVVGALTACLLPQAVCAQQEWQSTSTMQGSGSAYSSQVTAVGATGVAVLGASSSAPANAPSRPHREQASGRNAGEATTSSNQYPIGDALLPLLLMAAGFGVYSALRRRKAIIVRAKRDKKQRD